MAKKKSKKNKAQSFKSDAKKISPVKSEPKKSKAGKKAPKTPLNAPVTPVGSAGAQVQDLDVAAPTAAVEPLKPVIAQPLTPPVSDVIPDAWALDPETHTLIFESAGNRLTTVPLSPEFLEELLPKLNAMYIASSEAATEWQIRLPANPDLPPVLSLARGDAIAASLALTEETLADLDAALRTYYIRPEEKKVSPWRQLLNWYGRHRRLGTLGIIVLLPIVGFFLYSVGVQLFTV